MRVVMSRLLLIALVVALAGCGTAADDRESTAQTGSEEPAPAQMGLTGVLSEDEFKALHALTKDEAPAPRGSMVEIAGASCYLSLPEGVEPPFAGLVVIHEWWGLNEHIKHWADRLAADGYAALAVDLYGGETATTPDEAMALMKAVDETGAAEIMAAAHAFLKADPRIQASKRGSIGWCFGGGWSLQQALAQPDLEAAVIYYGRLVTDPDALKRINAQLLGIFGNNDTGIPPESVDAFEEGLVKAGVEHRILRYDAEHAFANPSGAHYDQEAAAEAWGEVRAFLAKELKGS